MLRESSLAIQVFPVNGKRRIEEGGNRNERGQRVF